MDVVSASLIIDIFLIFSSNGLYITRDRESSSNRTCTLAGPEAVTQDQVGSVALDTDMWVLPRYTAWITIYGCFWISNLEMIQSSRISQATTTSICFYYCQTKPFIMSNTTCFCLSTLPYKPYMQTCNLVACSGDSRDICTNEQNKFVVYTPENRSFEFTGTGDCLAAKNITSSYAPSYVALSCEDSERKFCRDNTYVYYYDNSEQLLTWEKSAAFCANRNLVISSDLPINFSGYGPYWVGNFRRREWVTVNGMCPAIRINRNYTTTYKTLPCDTPLVALCQGQPPVIMTTKETYTLQNKSYSRVTLNIYEYTGIGSGIIVFMSVIVIITIRCTRGQHDDNVSAEYREPSNKEIVNKHDVLKTQTSTHTYDHVTRNNTIDSCEKSNYDTVNVRELYSHLSIGSKPNKIENGAYDTMVIQKYDV